MCEIQRSSNSKAMTTINVTQEDIERGKRNSCFQCPLVYAISRALDCGVHVHRNCFFVRDELDDYSLPQSAIDFIAAFDAGEKVEPFSFEVEV